MRNLAENSDKFWGTHIVCFLNYENRGIWPKERHPIRMKLGAYASSSDVVLFHYRTWPGLETTDIRYIFPFTLWNNGTVIAGWVARYLIIYSLMKIQHMRCHNVSISCVSVTIRTNNACKFAPSWRDPFLHLRNELLL